MEYLLPKLDVKYDEAIWEKFGPISCTLNVDEAENIDETWKEIAQKIGEPVDVVKSAVQDMKEFYIILDHTRTLLITISDGCLPSNVGGGSNIRNILRRCFFILKKNNWWDKIGMDGFL